MLINFLKTAAISSIALSALLITDMANAYPIDGYSETGIRRLEYYRLSDTGEIKGKPLHSGAKKTLAEIKPRLIGKDRDPQLPALNKSVSARLSPLIPEQAGRYSIALLDLSDPDSPIYAEHNGDYRSNVGSVGKLLVAVAVFSKLQELYPNNVDKRREILRNTIITADEFVNTDHHKVRFWDVEKQELQRHSLHIGDRGNLYEYLDWALSPSSNAAAAMLQRELVLLSHFGKAYPVSDELAQSYLRETAKTDLGELFLDAMMTPLQQAGIDTEKLRQGSFFTRTGKNRVVGTNSYGNPKELIKLLYLMEAGKLVDEFSSTELKRLMYLTERRIRYASHPNLHSHSVYFKSGSLYSCQPEEGFTCGKYKGNKKNLLASVAIIESQEDGKDYHYLVVVQSNVLKINSAVAHQTLAARIHKLVKSLHKDDAIKTLQSDTPQ